MMWVMWVIIAVALWAVTNAIDKVILSKKIKNIFIYTCLTGIVGGLPLMLIPFYGISIPKINIILLGILAGMLSIYGLMPYFQALKIEEVSRSMPLWRFIPVFVLLFAFLFLGERFSIIKITAFFLLVIGGFLLSVRKIKHTLKISKAFGYMLFSSFLLAISYTLYKFIFQNQSFYNGFMFLAFGFLLAGLSTLLIRSLRKEIICTIKDASSKLKLLIVFNQILGLMGIVLFNLAISLGPVSLVTALGGFQPLFLLILTVVLSKKFPNILKEEITPKILFQKSLAILMLIGGAAIIILF